MEVGCEEPVLLTSSDLGDPVPVPATVLACFLISKWE